MDIIRLIVNLKIKNLKSYDQPDDGHELAETCRCILIRIYFLHTTVVLLTTFNIYIYTYIYIYINNIFMHNLDNVSYLPKCYKYTFLYEPIVNEGKEIKL